MYMPKVDRGTNGKADKPKDRRTIQLKIKDCKFGNFKFTIMYGL